MAAPLQPCPPAANKAPRQRSERFSRLAVRWEEGEGQRERMERFPPEGSEGKHGSPKRWGVNSPPPISVVLDLVDGGVLDSGSPGSPHAPSPQHLSIPRTPRSVNVSLDLSASLPPTPLKSVTSVLIEVLASGTLRTASSKWFHGQAWFPATMHALHVADSRVFVQVLLLGCSSRDLEWVPLDSVRKVKRVGLRSLCATGDDVEAAEVLGAIRVWYKGRMVPPPPDLEVASGSAAGARSSGGRRKVWVQLGEGGDGPVVGFDEDADIPTRLRRPPMQQPLTEQAVQDLLQEHPSPTAAAAAAATGGIAGVAGRAPDLELPELAPAGGGGALDDLLRFASADDPWVSDWDGQLAEASSQPLHPHAHPQPLDVSLLAELFCEREAEQLVAMAHSPEFSGLVDASVGLSWASLPPAEAPHLVQGLLERLEVADAGARSLASLALLVAALDIPRANPLAAAAVRKELGCPATLYALVAALACAVDDLSPPSLHMRGLSSVATDAPGATWNGGGDIPAGGVDDSSEIDDEDPDDAPSNAVTIRLEVGAHLNLLFVTLGELKAAASTPPEGEPEADAGAARRDSLARVVLAGPRAGALGEASEAGGRGGGSAALPVLLVQLLERAGEPPARYPLPFKKMVCVLHRTLLLALPPPLPSSSTLPPDAAGHTEGVHGGSDAAHGDAGTRRDAKGGARRGDAGAGVVDAEGDEREGGEAGARKASLLGHAPLLPPHMQPWQLPGEVLGQWHGERYKAHPEKVRAFATAIGNTYPHHVPASLVDGARTLRANMQRYAGMDEDAGADAGGGEVADMFTTREAWEGGAQKPADSPAAELYSVLFDQLPSLVMALLKLLLAASVNARGLCSPPVLDLYQDVSFDCEDLGDIDASPGVPPLLASVLGSDALPPRGAGAGDEQTVMHVWARHRAVLCAHAPAALLLLLKRLRRAHFLAAEYLARLVCDSNFLLLALKYLNQDCEAMVNQSPAALSLNTRIVALLDPSSLLLDTASPPPTSQPASGGGEDEDVDTPPPQVPDRTRSPAARHGAPPPGQAPPAGQASPRKLRDSLDGTPPTRGGSGPATPAAGKWKAGGAGGVNSGGAGGIGTAVLPMARRCERTFQACVLLSPSRAHPACASAAAAALLAVLRLLQRVVKYSPLRVRSLVNYKTPVILRKPLALASPLIQHYTLKLYKCMANQLGRKWKAANCHILTAIFMRLSPTLEPDYLAPDSDSQEDAMAADMRVRDATDLFNQTYHPGLEECGTEERYAGADHNLSVHERVALLLEAAHLPPSNLPPPHASRQPLDHHLSPLDSSLLALDHHHLPASFLAPSPHSQPPTPLYDSMPQMLQPPPAPDFDPPSPIPRVEH
ncbi:hypothetical protein T484DRAFT_1903800 [Baffinella frigidus]|nr:hypothetical protein T484DRAFT_1903800 [Cryptophyta sp. CCMP2293]